MSSVRLIYEAVEFHRCFCEEGELRTTLTFCGVPPSDLRTVQPIPRAAIMLTPAFFFVFFFKLMAVFSDCKQNQVVFTENLYSPVKLKRSSLSCLFRFV